MPIPVVTNGLARAEQALTNLERWSSGVVHFTRVANVPPSGIVFVEEGGLSAGGLESCGNVTDVPPPDPGQTLAFRWDAARAIVGLYTVHLGSADCSDETKGHYRSAIAEHELAHALGLIDHFDGFRGDSGFDDPRLLAVIYNLYANPPGVSVSDLVIWRR